MRRVRSRSGVWNGDPYHNANDERRTTSVLDDSCVSNEPHCSDLVGVAQAAAPMSHAEPAAQKTQKR